MLTRSFLHPKTAALLTAGVLACGAAALAQRAPLDREKARSDYPNYDIRDEAAGATAVAPKSARTAAAVPNAGKWKQSMTAGRSALASRVPALQTENNRFGTAPEVVGTTTGTKFLTAESATAKPQAVIRGFLTENAALYGLSESEVASLTTFADYANPAGNMSWVGLKQEINGLPVFQAELMAGFSGRGALARTTSNLVPGLEGLSLSATPALGAAEAIARASATIGRKVEAARLTAVSTTNQGRTSIVVGGPYTQATETSLVYFPLEPGSVALAYSLTLWDQPCAYSILVDANTGKLLWRKNITDFQSQAVTYDVYTGDSPAPLSPTTVVDPGTGTQAAGVARTTVTLIADDLTASPLGWITDGATATTAVSTIGNNVTAGLDLVAPNGIEGNVAQSSARAFQFSYNPAPFGGSPDAGDAPSLTAYRNGVVTNLFFWTNRYHDRLYNLGFTEPARNFQTQNFGRNPNGATTNAINGTDAVRAESQDYGGTNNANFATPADGSAPRMQMYLFTTPSPQRDGSLDGDVFLHEMTHGTSNRLHANGSGLAITQSGGMGEGWSDYYARCILSTADEDVDGLYASGAYVTYKLGNSVANSYYGIRRFPYASYATVGPNGKPHNPETFADVDPDQIDLSNGAYPPSPIFGQGSANEVHNIGEVWCSMLLEMRARIVKRLGYATGNNRALQIVTDAMKLDVASPNMVQARNSIIAADNAGFNGEDVTDIRLAFAIRGMGAGASTDGTSVVESYSPDLALGTLSFSDSLGNGNGVPEPGEDLLITVPLANVGTVAEPNVTARIGNYVASFNLAANGGAVTQTIPYRVPANTAPGTILRVPLTYTGLTGVFTSSLPLLVGSPVYGFTQNFDTGVTVPALPSGWTTTVSAYATGAVTGTAWKTVASPVVDAANSAFAPDLAGNTSGGGESDLISPAVTLPTATSGPVQLSFKHTYATEGGYDGCVLEISVAGGAYADILAAGGSFAQGGYSGAITTTNYGNPLQGRASWTGSTTAKTVLVNLPASALGQSVQFRWRLGFDNLNAATGWYVDTVRIVNGYSVAPIDTDGDGLQDGYETAHGLNPNDPTDAAKDADGDGVSNLAEYIAGTDPQNAGSALKVTQTYGTPSGGLTLVFPTVMGKVYTYDYKNSLTDSVWTAPGATYNGTGGDLTLIFSAADLGGQPQRFFRVRVVGQ